MKLIDEKQELLKENKDLRLNSKQNDFSSKAISIQNEQLSNNLNETQKELLKYKTQYNLLLEKMEGLQQEKPKQASSDIIIKNYEVSTKIYHL